MLMEDANQGDAGLGQQGKDQAKENKPVDGSSSSSSSSSEHLMKIAVKLPPFWTAQPVLWFQQVEAHFHINNIKSDVTKYFTVVASIESNILAQVSDIVRRPPESNKYETLKKRIVEQFADSETRKIKKLLSEIELADKRPSQLLNEMRELSGKEVTEEFLKSLFIQRMPSNVRAILSVSKDRLDEIAKMADKMLEVGDMQQVSAVSRDSSASTSTSSVVALEKKVDQLIGEISKLKTQFRGRSASRGYQERYRGRSRTRSKSRTQHEKCWYHYKFGAKANKCIKPCNFTSSEN